MVQPWPERQHETSELFGVVVRTTGFLVIIYSLWNVWAGFDNIFENILQMNEGGDADLPSSLIVFCVWCPGAGVGGHLFSSWPTGLSNWLTGIRHDAARGHFFSKAADRVGSDAGTMQSKRHQRSERHAMTGIGLPPSKNLMAPFGGRQRVEKTSASRRLFKVRDRRDACPTASFRLSFG